MADNRVLKLMEQSPLPQMVESLALSLAEAQSELDKKALASLVSMADKKNGVKLPGESEKLSMLELGFAPTFLQISEATITARVAFTCTETTEFSASASVSASYYGMLTATVSASYANKYSFETQGSSEITTRVIAVPPPTVLTERLRISREKLSNG